LLEQFNSLYLHSPALYEQDMSHEGMNVLLATPEVCVFERMSRHAADHMLILVNLGEHTSESLSLRVGSNRCYHLVCGVGAEALPAELMTSTSGLILTMRLPARTGAIYSLAS
jgi:1,4-alpha-glucan branching enzyme